MRWNASQHLQSPDFTRRVEGKIRLIRIVLVKYSVPGILNDVVFATLQFLSTHHTSHHRHSQANSLFSNMPGRFVARPTSSSWRHRDSPRPPARRRPGLGDRLARGHGRKSHVAGSTAQIQQYQRISNKHRPTIKIINDPHQASRPTFAAPWREG